MPSFHDTRFPANISLNSSGGPERLTRIVTLASGHEERNTPWAQSRRRYDAGYGVRSLDDIHAVLAFFEARRGRLHGFRWKDWADHRSGLPSAPPTPLDQILAIADGTATTYPLTRTYASGPAAEIRPITHPVAATVLAAIDGTPVPVTVEEGGTIAFASPPPSGAQITAGFEFDTPVRFDTDRLDIGLAGFKAGEIPSIPIVEIRV